MFSVKHSYSLEDSKLQSSKFLPKGSLSLADNSKRFLLSELLPYNPSEKTHNRLKNGLNEYKLILRALEEAMRSVSLGRYSDFDPLVGENACQIRALKNSLIFTEYALHPKKLLEKISFIKKKIEVISLNISILIQNGISLGDLLKNEELDIKLTYNEIFLVKSYLLTKIKVLRAPKEKMPFVKNEYTDAKKIKELGSVGTMFAESLIKALRESVSYNSLKFIQELALDLKAPDLFLDAISDKFAIRYRRLHCLPCYWATLILLLQTQKNKIPLVVIARQLAKDQNYSVVNETTLIFKHTSEGYREAQIPLKPNAPAIYLIGNSCRNSWEFPNLHQWHKELSKNNPLDLVLGYAATHRQYPDESKEHLIDRIHDERFEYYKNKGLEWGCSASNPSGFFLAHAFCDSIGNISKHTEIMTSDFNQKLIAKAKT